MTTALLRTKVKWEHQFNYRIGDQDHKRTNRQTGTHMDREVICVLNYNRVLYFIVLSIILSEAAFYYVASFCKVNIIDHRIQEESRHQLFKRFYTFLNQ